MAAVMRCGFHPEGDAEGLPPVEVGHLDAVPDGATQLELMVHSGVELEP